MFQKRFTLSVISSFALVLLPSTVAVADPSVDVMQWTLLGEPIALTEENTQWGTSVALNNDGTIMAAGAPAATIGGNQDQGLVVVYRFVNETWVPFGGALEGPGAGSFFGQSLSLNPTGLVLAVGAQGSGSSKGRVQVFDSSPTGWQVRGEPIVAPEIGQLFGQAVALSADGSTVVIGAPLDSLGGFFGGSVSVWNWSVGTWNKVGASSSGVAGDRLGVSVAISATGTIIAAGGSNHLSQTGIVRLYEQQGTTWKPLGAAPIVGNASGDNTGAAISLDAKGHTVAVGSPFSKKPGETARGSVEVFDLFEGSWLQRGDTIHAVGLGDRFGSSVAIDSVGTRLSVGAPRNGDAGLRAGHAHVFHFDSEGWQPLGQALPGRSAGDEAGTATAISGDGSRVAVGSPLRAVPSVRSGEVQVFGYPVLGTEAELELEEQVFKQNSGGLPGIHLHVVGSPGRLATKTPVHFGAYRVAPHSRYVLSVTAVGVGVTTPSTILAQGVVNRAGHLGGSISLNALAPGDYTVTLSGIHAGGTGLRLTAPFTVGSGGEIVGASPNIPGIW